MTDKKVFKARVELFGHWETYHKIYLFRARSMQEAEDFVHTVVFSAYLNELRKINELENASLKVEVDYIKQLNDCEILEN